MALPIPLPPDDETPEVIERCECLQDFGLWPPARETDARRWLENFEADERPYAEDLLRSFMYFNDDLAEELLRSAFQRLTPYVVDVTDTPDRVRREWQEFVSTVIVVPVTGEVPSPADSGYGYTRMVRDELGIKESQLMEAARALRELTHGMTGGSGQRPVVFVDDFVGSGNQFCETWARKYEVEQNRAPYSFQDYSATAGGQFFYCPVLCTSYGAENIRRSCTEVVLQPAHLLTGEYSALDSSSRIFAEERRADAVSVLSKIARRAGMPQQPFPGPDDWRGFHGLGLSVAIRDSIPDACLGIYRWSENNWVPLFPE